MEYFVHYIDFNHLTILNILSSIYLRLYTFRFFPKLQYYEVYVLLHTFKM